MNKNYLQGVEETINQKPWIVTIAVAGVVILISGAVFLVKNVSYQPEVEIMEVGEEENESIFVDVGGAVLKPGVYRLNGGARVNDALVAAGGLAEAADREWVSKNLNLAQKVEDGVKVYVPEVNETTEITAGEVAGKINVNSASISELDRLWGVGEATAKKIIENRPYANVEELLSKKVLKSNVYEEIKDKVSVY